MPSLWLSRFITCGECSSVAQPRPSFGDVGIATELLVPPVVFFILNTLSSAPGLLVIEFGSGLSVTSTEYVRPVLLPLTRDLSV